MARLIAAILVVLGLQAGMAQAQTAPFKDLPARVELHPIASLWISDQQFLVGDAGGKAITVAGELSLPPRPGRLPAVVLMHGSGGIGGNIGFWVREFNAMGIATFAIDGMTGRGLQEVGTQQAVLGRLNFILDIYRSLEILAANPRIDPKRVVLMGFSRGGQATLYASLKRFHKQWNKSGIEFAAYLPFYPDCATTYIDDGDVVDKPIRIFHGTPDNYNPVASCKRFVARLKEAGHDVQLTEFPNAQHGFDNPIGANPALPAKANQSVRDCAIRETAPGVLTNAETGAPFTYKDACVRLDPLVGADPEAREGARQAVEAFLRTTFALN